MYYESSRIHVRHLMVSSKFGLLQIDLTPFDTIGVSATPSPLAHIWAQGIPKNHIKPRNEVSER